MARKGGTKHQPRGLDLLYEDQDVVVIAKPSGLPTIGTARDKTRTVHAILNDYVRKGNPKSRQRIYVVHRLDRDTSGVLLFAKSEPAKHYLQEHWEETEKRYLAVVHGRLVPPSGTISSYLTENSALRVFSTPDPTAGKLAQTEYATLREVRGFSLLELRLLTGRKHQIRVHLADRGHPVVGDKRYGRANAAHRRLALHARSLSFRHPVSGEELTFEATAPAYFKELVGSFEHIRAQQRPAANPNARR